MKILLGILILVSCFSLFVLSALFNEIRKYLIWKRNTNTYPIMKNANELINNTNELLSLISDRIDEEINSHFQKYVLLEDTYPLTRLDEDISIVATSVYNGIKASLFEVNKEDFALNTDYFMRYIVNTTKLRVTSLLKEWNDQIHIMGKPNQN